MSVTEQLTSTFYSFTKTRFFKGLVTLVSLYVMMAVGYNLYKSLYPNPYVDKRNVLDDLSNKLFAQTSKWGRKNLTQPDQMLENGNVMAVLKCTDLKKTVRFVKKYDVAKFIIPSQAMQGRNENKTHRNLAFREIYQKGEWSKNSSLSGPGSTLEITKNVRRTLDAVINLLKSELNKTVIHMLDVPCGDFSWMREFLRSRNDVIYTGMDVVPELIQKLKSDEKNNSKFHFKLVDIVDEPITEHYDLIFSRHLAQHLTNQDTLKMLKSFSDSNSRYLLMTTYPNTLNTDLIYGMKYRFRAQNLEIPPYALAPPICQDIDGSIDMTALWKLPLSQISKCEAPSVLNYQNDIFDRRVYNCK